MEKQQKVWHLTWNNDVLLSHLPLNAKTVSMCRRSSDSHTDELSNAEPENSICVRTRILQLHHETDEPHLQIHLRTGRRISLQSSLEYLGDSEAADKPQ
jgi:hypothetical protein